MPLAAQDKPAPMPADTLLFILTGLYGQPAIDKLLADMANNDGEEVNQNGSTKKAG